MSLLEVLSLLGIGLLTGALGGMLGIGGSIIIIPALTLAFGKDIHLAQASAMIINVFVAVPAAVSHDRAKAVQWKLVWMMLPFGVAMIVTGVLLGNTFKGQYTVVLERIFGVFLLYVVLINIARLMGWSKRKQVDLETYRPSWWRVGTAGSIVGFAAGLLGVGGGVLTVPLLQRLCHTPLRLAIATSSTVMCLTAAVGAALKNVTLPSHGLHMTESFLLAACLAPTAFLGGFLGAKLTHKLPVNYVRAAFTVVLVITSYKMLTADFAPSKTGSSPPRSIG